MTSANPTLPGQDFRSRDVRRVLAWLLVLNLAVAAAKVAYGTMAAALSIRADGLHSITDSSNNVIGMFAVWLSSRPADSGHPYGHRKFELVAAGLLGVLLLAMAVDVLHGAAMRLLHESVAPHIDAAGFAIMGATLAINVFVALYETRRGEALQSPFLLADAAHTRSDVFVTLGVVASMGAVLLGYPIFDTLAAVAVAIFIAWAGLSVLRANLGYLTDMALVSPGRIEAAAVRVPGVASAHKVRSRGIPGAVLVDLHIQIAPHLDVVRAHQVTHWVIDAIKRDVPGISEVVVHTEPARPGQPYPALPWETDHEERE